MCGILGFLAPKSTQEWRYETLRNLLIESAPRGRDATGIAFVDPTTRKVVVIKEGVEAKEFIKGEEFRSLEGNLPPIIMGHVRDSSRWRGGTGIGQPLSTPDNNENNHPFYSKYSGIALLHNGRVDDDMWRNTAGDPGGILHPCVSETDSEIALRILETFHLNNPAEDFKKSLQETCFNLAGSYALVVMRDGVTNKLWFVRHERPLVFGWLHKLEAIVFASSNQIIKDSLLDYRFYHEFFYERIIPRMTINDLDDDHILEIRAPATTAKTGKFKISSVKIKYIPDDKYKYHTLIAKKELEDENKQKEEKEETEEREGIVSDSQTILE